MSRAGAAHGANWQWWQPCGALHLLVQSPSAADHATCHTRAGLFEFSMKYQDGTRPTNYDESSFTPERREW